MMALFYASAGAIAAGLSCLAWWLAVFAVENTGGRLMIFLIIVAIVVASGALVVLWSAFPRIDRFSPPGPTLERAANPELATCERHGVNPEAYLADVLLRIQDHPKQRLAELLPHRWRETFGSGFITPPSDAT